MLLGVAAPADVSPLLALQLFAAALAATRNPLLGVAVIVALPHVADWLTAVLLLAAVALRVRRRGAVGDRRGGLGRAAGDRGRAATRATCG